MLRVRAMEKGGQGTVRMHFDVTILAVRAQARRAS